MKGRRIWEIGGFVAGAAGGENEHHGRQTAGDGPAGPRSVLVHGSVHIPGGRFRVSLDTPAGQLPIRAASTCHEGLAL